MPENQQQIPGKVPRWYRLTWFLGRAPELSERQWSILGLVAGVSFFEQYDMYLFSLNLSHIQAELEITEGNLGYLGSIVRAGALLSVLITLAADRLGRRQMLIFTVILYTLLTGATAFSPNAETFVVLQFFARTFAVAEVLIAVVVIAEEFPPQHRGWGIGALAAIQACGAGLAALLFSMVEILPFGWRSLYLVGLVPLILIAYWRRNLPETDLFETTKVVDASKAGTSKADKKSLFEPIIDLLRNSRRNLILLCSVLFFLTMGTSSASFFAPKYLQDVHNWSPAGIAILMAVGGAFAIIGNPLAGWLSDRFGRKPTSIGFSLAFIFVAIVFYGSLGVAVPFMWVALIFVLMGSDVTIATYGTELFPTRVRSTAAGVRAVFGTLSASIGLAAVSVLYAIFGSNWVAIMVLCSIGIIAPILFFLLFPETAGRELQEISPDEYS